MQLCVATFKLGEFPGLVGIDVLVGKIGQRHDLADCFAEFAAFVIPGNLRRCCRKLFRDFGGHRRLGELAGKFLADKAGCAAGDVHILADQIAVDARQEIVGIEIEVLDLVVQLGGDVVAQPFGIEAQFDVLGGAEADAARFGHLLAGDLQEAVHKDIVRHLAPGKLEHRRPEQGVEIDDVLADEVVLLDLVVGHELIEAALLAARLGLAGIEIRFQAGEVTNRRIQPDVEIFTRCIGDLDAEVGRVAGNVPIVERFAARFFVVP